MKPYLTLPGKTLLVAALLALLLAAASPLAALTDRGQDHPEARDIMRFVCGYDPRWAEDHLYNHKINRRRLEAQSSARLSLASASGPQVEGAGNLSIVRDDGTIVLPPSKFDLKKSSLLFTPEGDGYRITRDSIAFNMDFGSRLTFFFGPGDVLLDGANDGYREVQLIKAQFPFFGVRYDRMYVGTNGYITFSRGDTLARPSVAALVSELPRIAPMWADLDATTKGAIYYNRFEDRYTVTWNAVQAPQGGANTFQVVLYDDGRIGFVYKKVKARTLLIGISPGAADGEANALDLSSPPDEAVTGPAFEFFSKSKRLDLPALTRAFYGSHQDAFDVLYIWTDFAFDNGLGVAHAFNVRNDIQGIGLGIFDHGSVYGSQERLSSIITMGNIVDDWPDDPQAHVVGLNSAVSIVCHELGHRWLSYVLFDAEHDIKDDLLGRQFAHWSFFVDTRTREDGSFSSLMEGNAWRDNGNGTFTTIETAVNYFSDLDQYLMGLRAASEVGPITYLVVDDQLKSIIRSKSPVSGFSMTATRKRTTVEQIIEREGLRVPDVTTSPKSFRIAFILLTEAGKAPSESTLAKLERYRTALIQYFSIATGRRASLESGES